MKNNKILVIGDIHFRSSLPYSDYIEGGRQKEEDDVLNFMVENSNECDKIVLLGDALHSRTNPPEVIRKFTNFIERFDGKEIFILAGNHTKFGSGKTGKDFLKEIKNKNWHLIFDDVEKFGDLVFCPFFTKAELEVDDNEKSRDEIMKKLLPGKILFIHHAISDTKLGSFMVDNFPEAVLLRDKLEKKYKLVVAGHIHSSQVKNRTIICGSTQTQEIGELEKFIWKINEQTLAYEQIKLPCRPIYKLEIEDKLPTEAEWNKFNKKGIIKATIKQKKTTKEIEELTKRLEEFDAHILIENLPRERKKMHIEKGQAILEFSVDQLLELYGKERNVSLDLLKRGFELVRI